MFSKTRIQLGIESSKNISRARWKTDAYEKDRNNSSSEARGEVAKATEGKKRRSVVNWEVVAKQEEREG